MKLTKKIILAIGLVAAAGVSFAQNTSTGAAPVGVLGQNYTEIGFGVQDIEDYSPNAYGTGLGANVPVTKYLDVGASYSYNWIRGNSPGHQNTLGATATAYTALNNVKPFVGVGLGYQWAHFTGFSDDRTVWAAAIGVEIPVGAITLTPRTVYNDDFEGSANSSQSTTYEVEGNYWVNRTTAVFASIGKTDYHGTSTDSWNYGVGVRLKF